jgi:carboxypeptidase family protein
MTRTCRRASRVVPGVLVLSLCFSSLLLAQRSDRATITGVVTDEQGNAIPRATVTIHSVETGVDTVLVTNDAGAYQSPPLVLGRYTVTVNLTGFKKATTEMLLSGGDLARRDLTIQVGSVEETVKVVGVSEGLAVTQPDVRHTVNEKYYRDLPIITAADVRLAESVLNMQPGYLPMKPNGDPIFRGSQFASRMNGGQTRATENFFDGAAFGSALGHQESHESAPPVEAIQEMKVISTTYSAQYGHTSGGFIEYTSKSGTNTLHGGGYWFMADDVLNSQPAVGEKSPLRNDSYGLTLGGPVVLGKLYKGRNKTFFFTNFDWTRFRSGVLPGFGNTTPIDAFKAGNFSALLTASQIGTDVLGRPIFAGQIFNPATTSLVNGIPVRDPYPGNVIPPDDPLRSAVAARVAFLMVRPDRPGLAFNVAGNGGGQTWELDARNILVRADHNFTPSFRSSISFYWNRRPSIRNCGGPGGCTTEFDGETEPEKNDTYYGNGFYQRISTHHAHQQFDWIISNHLLNHTTIAYDRWFMGGNPLSAGVGWPQLLWGASRGGILDNTAGPPEISFGGNIPYSTLGTLAWPRFGYEVTNRWQVSDNLTWVKGRHTIKTGFEYRWHQFPNRGSAAFFVGGGFHFNGLGTGGYDAAGNNLNQTGDPFASFLLGQVHVSFQTIPVQPTFNEAYTAAWINDEFKVTDRLTLTCGLRFDYQFARTEHTDQYSSFDPIAPNPGAGGIPGALIFAGEGAGRSGRRKFENPDKDAWGPRAGFSYRLGDKNALRGGYGIYYAGVAFSQFAGSPTLGFQANLLAPNLTNGLHPAFYLDDGFPQDRVVRPPFIDPTFANGGNIVAVTPDGLTLPRFQNWSVTFQRQLTDNMMLDVSYIENRGSRLNNHGRTLGVEANMNDPGVLSLGAAVLNADINSDLARQAGISPPYPGFQGNVAQALRKYPQYQGVEWRGSPTGRSQYHALEVVLERRFSQGLQARVGYTYSRLRNNGAESALGNEPINDRIQNPAVAFEWSLSSDDAPHVLLTGFTWEVPGSEKWTSGLAKALLAGWNVSGVLRYESGRPLNIVMANDLFGFLFNSQKRPNSVSGVDATVSNFDGTGSYFNREAWSDPGPLQFGNAPRNDGSVRDFPVYSEDVNIFKVFQLTGTQRIRFETLIGNLFNRVLYCTPDTNWSSGTFGTVNVQCNTPRSIQFGFRYDF